MLTRTVPATSLVCPTKNCLISAHKVTVLMIAVVPMTATMTLFDGQSQVRYESRSYVRMDHLPECGFIMEPQTVHQPCFYPW